MSSPTTILATKDLIPQTFQPLLLAKFQFADGSFLYLSTHPLNANDGGSPYGGHNWLPRILRQDISAIQARSQQGIDRIPAVTLHLADSDKLLWTNVETNPLQGFRGAVLTLLLIYWQVGTPAFSSDSWAPFIGICETPQMQRVDRVDVLTVNAVASHSNSRVTLPVWHVQQLCGNTFARNGPERFAGGTDMSSQLWGCGYDPDQGGTDPEKGGDCRRGNTGAPNQKDPFGRPITDGAGVFVQCNYTRANCMERLGNSAGQIQLPNGHGVTIGDIGHDKSGRVTGRFSGIQFAPQDRTTRGKSYLLGKTVISLEGRNDAIYKQFVPMLYGEQWVVPIVCNELTDPNSTRSEVIICQDYIGPDGIVQVVVNGVIVPQDGIQISSAGSITGDDGVEIPQFAVSQDPLFRWAWVNTGGRSGAVNRDALYDGKGDPYGSLACIEVVVYSQIVGSGSTPDVRVLARGPYFKIPSTADVSNQAAWPRQRSTNPCWVLLDAMIWSNYQYKDFDLQSFIDESPYCDQSINYQNLTGDTVPHERFKCQFALLQPRPAGDVIAAILRSFNAQLIRNPQTGLLRLMIRKTLPDQQPHPIPGSNYNSPVPGLHADGSTGSGYVAFLFDETTIYRDDPDSPPVLPVIADSASNVPTTVTIGFQDEDNSFADDSCTVRDTDAIARAGGYQGSVEVQESLNVIGISGFDQAVRVINTYLAERNRGNENGDTRGTRQFQIQSSSRVVHLKTGDICMLKWQPLGLVPSNPVYPKPVLVRVQAIQPSSNFERAIVTVSWHEDAWYTDLFGQSGPAQRSNPSSARPNRAPYALATLWLAAHPRRQPLLEPTGLSSGLLVGLGVAPVYTTLMTVRR